MMLPRSHAAITGALSNYLVADVDGTVIGCGGLDQYGNESAEVYGLATTPGNPHFGAGTAIVQALIEKARNEKISHVFAMTLAPGFFQKMGFRTAEHKDVPMKVWKDCVACPKYGNCDEIAMVLNLN